MFQPKVHTIPQRYRAFIGVVALLLLLHAGGVAHAQAELPVVHTAAAANARILVQGSPLRSGNGITTDHQGRLYVASVTGQDITVFDARNGRILQRFGRDIGVQSPDDVAIGPDGSIYWTGLFSGEVVRIRPDGTNTIIAQLGPGPNPITFSADGRLFVGIAVFGDALYELDPEGVTPPRLVVQNLGGLNAFDFGPDGLLYSPLRATRSVIRINVDTGESAVVATDFQLVSAVRFNNQGILHVADPLTGELFQVDIVSGAKTVVAELAPGLDNFVFDSQDRFFGANIFDGSVIQLLPNGRARTLSPGGIVVPSGVAVLPGQNGREEVFVADFFSLRSYDGRSGREQSFTPFALDRPGLTTPSSVAVDGNNLLLTSWFFNAVQVWDPVNGAVVQQINDFAQPVNALRFQGDLIVAEAGSGNIVRAEGANPANRTVLAAGLNGPSGLAATADDLWAVDFGAGRVLQLLADGQPRTPPTVVATGLNQPEGLAVDLDGTLLVVESGAGRLLRVNPVNGAVATVAEGLTTGLAPLPNTPPTGYFSGVTVAPSGTIYVIGDQGGNLYRILPRQGGSSAGGAVTFTDIAPQPASGITYQRTRSAHATVWDAFVARGTFQFPDELAFQPFAWRGKPGVAIFDYDNDDDLDLYVTNGPGTNNSLYANQLTQSGLVTFVDVAMAAGVGAADQDSAGVCFGDTDNDGDPDLFILSNVGANRFFVNNGDGTFTDQSLASGLGVDNRSSYSCSFGDVNGDGLLDVAIGNSISDPANILGLVIPFQFTQHNQLFLNQGGNLFTDVSVASGLQNTKGFGPFDGSPSPTWAIAMVDYDLDGDLDIIHADDQGGVPRAVNGGIDVAFIHIFANDGSGQFTDVTVEK